MTLTIEILNALRAGPRSRPQLERHAIEVGYAPAGVARALWELKKAGKVAHIRYGGRHRKSLYAINANPINDRESV